MTEHDSSTGPSSPPPLPPRGKGPRAVLAYTAARLALFAVVGGVLYVIGLRRFALVIVALIVTMPLSYVLLRTQRTALTAQLETRVQRRRDVRARLRGTDDAGPDRAGPDRTGPDHDGR